jgi:hypothetical protein
VAVPLMAVARRHCFVTGGSAPRRASQHQRSQASPLQPSAAGQFTCFQHIFLNSQNYTVAHREDQMFSRMNLLKY